MDHSVSQKVTIAEAQILHNEHQLAFHAHELSPTTGCANHKEHTADDVIDMAEVQQFFLLDSGADMDVTHWKDVIIGCQSYTGLLLTNSARADHVC